MYKTIGITVVCLIIGWLCFCVYRSGHNGITPVGKNAVLIEGEAVVINWNATNEEADKAIAQWKTIK
jgi:hypothetical protein